MGWLRDLMLQATPAVPSFGELARSVRGHDDWPASSDIHPRSLASIFSKLDRGQELDWLIDRPAVQKILAQTLSTSLSEIRAALGAAGPREAAVAARRVRLRSLRDARFLDLTEEPLFPGIPPEVLESANWRRTFWYAPSGSGRSLTGQWLASRGLASFVSAPSWAEARPRLPARGAVFVELDGYDDAGQALEDVPERICIAAPFLPAKDDAEAFELVQSPPPDSYLEDLLLWIDERLPRDGRFDVDTTLEWLRGAPREAGLLDGVGAVLDLAGLADQLGAREIAALSPEKLALRFLRQRLSESLDSDDANARWLKRSGHDALVAMLRRILTDDDLPWDAPRTLEHWMSLVPPELSREADVEWLRLSLHRVDASIRASDVERAARRLPPGAFRTVQSLRASGLLEPGPGERFKLGPRWFARTLLGEAVSSLVRGSPFEWGEALLRPHAAPLVARALSIEIGERSLAPIEAVLELEADDSAAHGAALEACFRALGIALLCGTEAPSELLEALWDEQVRLLVALPQDLPAQRVELADPRGPGFEEPDAALFFDRGTFLLAALAISEELPSTSSRHPLLRPWLETSPDRELRRVYDRIFELAVRAHPRHRWALEVFALVDRLRNAVGFVDRPDAPHELELPGAVLDELMHGVLAFGTVEGAGKYPLLLDALAELGRARGVSWPAVARAVWSAWSDAGRPEAPLLSPDGPFAQKFWPHLPPELLQSELASPDELTRIPYAWLGPEHWQVVADALRAGSPIAAEPRVWSAAPESLLRSVLGASPLPLAPAALRAVAGRFPELVLEMLRARLEGARVEHSDDVTALIDALPLRHAAEVSALFGRLRTLYSLSAGALVAVRRYLHRAVAARAPGFREAFAELSNIERKVSA